MICYPDHLWGARWWSGVIVGSFGTHVPYPTPSCPSRGHRGLPPHLTIIVLLRGDKGSKQNLIPSPDRSDMVIAQEKMVVE